MLKYILHSVFIAAALTWSVRATAPELILPEEPVAPRPDARMLDIVDSYDAFLQEAIERGEAPGAAVAIVQNGSVLLTKGYGVRSLHERQPVDDRTVFRIASLSKSMAALLTGRLVEEELLHWNDPVISYLPDFRLRSQSQTERLELRHLLSHSTGLPYHTYSNLIEKGESTLSIMQRLTEVKLIAKEGRVYAYQNAAFSLIGEVIQAATGNSYQANMQQKVFNPLHMADASVTLEDFLANPNVAKPHKYLRQGQWRELPPSPKYYNAAPAGGVNASAQDMAQYLLAMLGNRPDVLSEEIRTELATPVVSTPIRNRYFRRWQGLRKSSYGLGWRIVELEDDTLLYHGGYVAGYRAEIAVSLRHGFGVCVLFNGGTGFASEAVPKFLELYRSGAPTL
ncbi:MAG: beta-lactamase family protein [Saprospiraceae bacterium]|nr:beta-lactamase family protein [Saprospiraceae bacterium]MCB0624819.1 beta-lactamase family protein [Saprospiraceae bacterium]